MTQLWWSEKAASGSNELLHYSSTKQSRGSFGIGWRVGFWKEEAESKFVDLKKTVFGYNVKNQQ